MVRRRRVCRDCTVPKKCGAFPDENGIKQRLCAKHARLAGTYTLIRRVCQQCPVGNQLSAAFPDLNGISQRLCAKHARECGVIHTSQCGASRVACRFFDTWKVITGQHIPHIHFAWQENEDGTRTTITEGHEVRGLVPGRRLRPDGFVKRRDGKDEVWLFHGNYYHGYPPNDPRHGQPGIGGHTDLYQKTVVVMNEYVAAQFRVLYVWEHEFLATRNSKDAVLNVVHEWLG